MDIKAVAFVITGIPFMMKARDYMDMRKSVPIVSEEVANVMLVVAALLFIASIVTSIMGRSESGSENHKSNVFILSSYVAMWAIAYIVTSIGGY